MFGASTLPACGAGTVASYEVNTSPSAGCAISFLDYYNFSYVAGTNAPAASAINVAPAGLGFSFGPVTAAAGQTVSFEVDYEILIDPTPVITGDDLGLDVSGNITVTEYFCNDKSYIGNGQCLGGTAAPFLQVGNGNGLPNSATITFSNPATTSQSVGIVFTLVGGTNGASFQGLDSASITNVPEPASIGCALLGLALLGGGYKLKRSRRS